MTRREHLPQGVKVDAAVLENFQRGRPSSFLVQVPVNAGGSLFDGVAQFHVKNQGFALQDTWTVNPRLTIQYGVRVDTPLMPDSPLRNTAAAAAPIAGSVSGTTVTRQGGGFGLDNTHTWGRTYWGGAMFCLLADVEIRRRTHNRRGLQDAGVHRPAAARPAAARSSLVLCESRRSEPEMARIRIAVSPGSERARGGR